MRRLSRKYIDGIGKPVVKKLYDDVIGKHRWEVVFPPRNNHGNWIVVPEAIACGKAEDWCDRMNEKLRRTEFQRHQE